MESWQKDKKSKAEKKKQEELVKNAHLKIYNQVKKPFVGKHGGKNSISSWTDYEERKAVPNKHTTQNTLTTSDNVSEQIKKLTKKDSQEKIAVV